MGDWGLWKGLWRGGVHDMVGMEKLGDVDLVDSLLIGSLIDEKGNRERIKLG